MPSVGLAGSPVTSKAPSREGSTRALLAQLETQISDTIEAFNGLEGAIGPVLIPSGSSQESSPKAIRSSNIPCYVNDQLAEAIERLGYLQTRLNDARHSVGL